MIFQNVWEPCSCSLFIHKAQNGRLQTRQFNLPHMPNLLDMNKTNEKLCACLIQCSQEPQEVIHIALCTVALRSNMICASTLRHVLARDNGIANTQIP